MRHVQVDAAQFGAARIDDGHLLGGLQETIGEDQIVDQEARNPPG
jgi:hypothetical protein